MTRENNYKELENLMKRLFVNHYHKNKIDFSLEDVINEVYGINLPLDNHTINEIADLLRDENIKYEFNDRKKIETYSSTTKHYKVVLSIDEFDFINDIKNLIKSLKNNHIDFSLEISLFRKKSNIGIRLNEGKTLKLVSNIVRNEIARSHLNSNLPYIPTVNNIGVVLESKEDVSFEDTMNTYIYNHLIFAMKKDNIDYCHPDFIIRNLEIYLKDKENSNNKIVLDHLKLLKDFSMKENKYGNMRK